VPLWQIKLFFRGANLEIYWPYPESGVHMTNPLKLIIVGGILVTAGFLIPLLMVLNIINATLLLSFLSHSFSVIGLALGFLGAAMYSRARKG
jgi:hypothetical protein